MKKHKTKKPKQKALLNTTGKEKHVGNFCEGVENKDMKTIGETARNPDLDFDWKDAAMLSHKTYRVGSENLKTSFLFH